MMNVFFGFLGLRKLKPDTFYDLPGIVMPALGLGMFGLTAVVSLM